MPNKKGGKAYKKGKAKGENDENEEFIDIQPDQYIARVMRLLGDRNVMCYSNDNIVRICHICRKMKGREWIGVGDIVLISLRYMECATGTIKRGDVLAKFPSEQVRHLQKDPNANPRLFIKLEEDKTVTDMEMIGIDLSGTKIVTSEQNDGYVFESGSEEEEEEEEETKVKVAKKDKVSHGRGERRIREETEIRTEDL
jgi:translation initiation factor 1A